MSSLRTVAALRRVPAPTGRKELLQSCINDRRRRGYFNGTNSRRNNPLFSSSQFHTHVGGLSVDDEQERKRDEKKRLQSLPSMSINRPTTNNAVRLYHTSAPAERSAVPIILGLGALSAASYAASSGVKAWKEYKASLPETPPEEEDTATENVKDEGSTEEEPASKDEKKEGKKEKRENIFVRLFNMETGYYEGGFEETMTKQEAALILGVRQSSSPAKIKDAHR